MKFLSPIFYICIVSHVTAAPNPPRPPPPQGSTYALEKNYQVNFQSDEDGGCKKYESGIRTAYAETLDMIWAGQSAMEALRNPMPPDSDLQGQNEWKRKASTFYVLFGSSIPKQGWNDYHTHQGQSSGDEVPTHVSST